VGVWRKWVFPILRIVVFAVIAAALVKLAFFADASGDAAPAVPTGSITDPVMTVERGSIVNDVAIQGAVSADAAVAVKAVAAGTVDELFVSEGSVVSEGDLLYDIKVETPRDPVETVGADGSVEISQPKPVISFEKVFAPTGGTLSSLTVLHGQAVAVGDVGGQVAPSTFSATGTLEPAQQYRLLDRPSEATVTISGGPAPFTCTDLTITTPLAGESSSGSSGNDVGGGAGGGTAVRCAIPDDVTVFAGLAAEITIPAGQADDVLVIPTTAVDGGAQSGIVFVTSPDGDQEERPVTLGLSDGSRIEVVDGLEEGETILQFTPNGSAPMNGDDCYDDGSGAVICAGGMM